MYHISNDQQMTAIKLKKDKASFDYLNDSEVSSSSSYYDASIIQQENDVAKLLAELSGHKIFDISNNNTCQTKGSRSERKARAASYSSYDLLSESSSTPESYFEPVGLKRSESGIDVGRALVSLGRMRSNSVGVISTSSNNDLSSGRPRG